MAFKSSDPSDKSWRLFNSTTGVSQLVGDWGASGLVLERASQGRDTLRFTLDGAQFDEADGFSYGDTVRLLAAHVGTVFVGKVIQTPSNADEVGESKSYVVAGPWWDLEELVYQVQWAAGFSSHFLTNVNDAGVSHNIKTELELILNYAIDQGVGLQIGDITPDATPPIDEPRDISCAAAILKQLRWAPVEAITWFDYTTSPPTFHCKLASELDAINLPVATETTQQQGSGYKVQAYPEAATVQRVRVSPRSDLVRPAVVIKYEIRNTVDGQDALQLSIDKFPLTATGTELGAMVITLDSLGATINNLFASLLTDDIDADSANSAARIAWWKSKQPSLNDSAIDFQSVTVATRRGLLGLPRELIEGQIADWMQGPFTTEQETLDAKAVMNVYDRAASDPDAVLMAERIDVPLSINLVATNATTGDYRDTQIEEQADPIPTGLAEFVYNRLQTIHQEGTIDFTVEEIGDNIGNIGRNRFMGNLVNVTGGKAVWASMNALVQHVTEVLETGETSLRVGPPSHLDIPGLLSLLRVGRDRLRSTPLSQFTNGTIGSNQLKLGKQTANANAGQGEGTPKLLRVKDDTVQIALNATDKTVTIEDTTDPGRKVTIDLDDAENSIAAAPGDGLLIRLREYTVCVLEGEQKVERTAVFLASEPYAGEGQ